MATGGFSTKGCIHWSLFQKWCGQQSLFRSSHRCIHVLGRAVNFLLHFQALRGNLDAYRKNSEFRFYCVVVMVAVLLLTVSLRIIWHGARDIWSNG